MLTPFAFSRKPKPPRPTATPLIEAPPVAGDPDQLHQVLVNLLRNAISHTPSGTPIEVGLARDGERAVLTVRDHGPGLPDGVADRIFERFWRSDPGRSRGRGGAGLGLAIVQGIVRAHDGEVHAANAPDGGAMFSVLLPLAGLMPQKELRERLRDLAPTGEWMDLSVELSRGTVHDPWQLQTSAKFRGVGFAPLGRAPGLRGLSGVLDGDANSGRLEFDTQTAVFHWPGCCTFGQ